MQAQIKKAEAAERLANARFAMDTQTDNENDPTDKEKLNRNPG